MNRFAIIFLWFTLQACKDASYTYRPIHIENESIEIDGLQDEKLWSSAERITSFQNPWDPTINPETSLAMMRDSQFVYFYFEVSDEEVILDPDFSKEEDVVKEDRVELFFSKDQEMGEYYCFEMDPKGRTLAYAAQHYRKVDFAWDAPQGFNIATREFSGGYAVEGAIPMEFIKQLAKDGAIYFGAYRAEFSKKDGVTIENWLTWVNPHTEKPDFHVPASMGKLYLK
jgi:hypothetical protein